jgi:hypothetical protein
MEFVTDIAPSDLVGIRLLAESNQFAIYATGLERYLLVQRHASLPWTGLMLSGDAIFRFSELLGAAGRDLYHEVAGALSPTKRDSASTVVFEEVAAVYVDGRARKNERPELYQDDLTEERDITPRRREEIAATLVGDPDIIGDEGTGEPLTRRGQV